MKTVLVYSGGMDSTVLLHYMLAQGFCVKTLSIDYGQKHQKEIEAACVITTRLGVEHRVIDLRGITPLLTGNSLTTPEINVPDGHYTGEYMKSTVVPNRNMIILSVAAAWAISSKYESVSYATHSGDHAIYPDCREAFAEAIDQAIQLADWHKVWLNRPFVCMSKAEIVALGANLGVSFADTWSCYKGGALHCGRCGTCVERREAFHLAGVPDPTTYDASTPSLEQMIAANWKL
jgi:7-cyano-7-deazaguanine synthase